MNLKILKLLVINIIIVNYFNYALGSELIIPKNKPSINKDDIKLNKINYLLPKNKPILQKKLLLKRVKKFLKLQKKKMELYFLCQSQ